MKPDLYTKATLTVIALMFTAIALRPIIAPERTVVAQSSRADETHNRYMLQQINEHGPQAGAAPTTVVFDNMTGQLWELVDQKCGDTDQQGWMKMPSLGSNELPKMMFSCGK